MVAVTRDVTDLFAVVRFGLSGGRRGRARIADVICLPHGPVGQRKQKRKQRPLQKLIVFLALCALSRTAIAQEAEVLTPIQLFEEEAGPGVQIGSSLLLSGQAEAQVVHDSNIYNTEFLKQGDTLAVFKPKLLLQTDGTRHFAQLEANAEVRRYFDISDEDSEQYALIARTALDLGQRFAISTEAAIEEKIELRGTAGDAFSSDKPIEYSQKRVGVELSRTGGILELIGGISYAEQEFEDAAVGGMPLDLTFRDVAVSNAKLRANYRVSENTKFFTELNGNMVEYDINGPVSRDSEGFAAFAGVQHNPSPLVNVEAAIGFIQQDFDDPSVGSTTGVNYYVNANWSPTPELQFTASGQRVVDPSPVSNVPAIIRSDFDLGVQRAIGDRVLVEAHGGYTRENYKSGARTDERYTLEAGVRYRITDRIGATAFVGYRKQDSNVLNESYDGVSVGLSLRALL